MAYQELEQTPDLLTRISGHFTNECEEAIKNRKNSGLDDLWKKAREQYQGIDEVNRARSYTKSDTLDGSLSTSMGKVKHEKRSTVFVNITRPYTNAGVARVADILLPTGGKNNWDLKQTPISETALLAGFVSEQPNLLEMLPPDLQLRLTALPEDQEASMAVAKEFIQDSLTETNWHSHTRKQIVEAGKVGTGVLKGPYSKKRILSSKIEHLIAEIPARMEDQEQAQLLQSRMRIRLMYQPAIECIPVENCYPDMPSCGDNIQNGRFFWEEAPNISRLELQELADDPESGYFTQQLLACLDEDPKPNKAKGEAENKKKKSYTKWHRTGEFNLGKFTGNPQDGVAWVELEIINERVVKINEPPLDNKEFPYRMLLWEPRQDSWAGIGIPEQIETPQRGLNASVRAGNDNMGWSVGFQIVLGPGLEPTEGSDATIEPYTIWKDVTETLASIGGKDRNARDAMSTIEFPNHLDKILIWIDFWLKMAESTTGLSLLMQGQKSTDSVGVSQMLMNSTTTNLRMFIKHWDDDNCAPTIQNMYRWVQRYGPETAQGDAVAMALGSSVLIVRDLQQQALVQLLDRFVQPEYGKSPEKGMDLFLESLQFDPRQLDMSDEERTRLEAAASEPDPKIQVEQLRGQSAQAIAQLKDQTDRLELYLDAQLKGQSLDSATETVETQVAGNIAQEAMKQEAKIEKEPLAKPPTTTNSTEPSIDESLAMLGLES